MHTEAWFNVVTLRQANSWVQAGKCSSGAAFLHRQRCVHQHGSAMALPLSSPALHFRALTNTSICAQSELSLLEIYTHRDIQQLAYTSPPSPGYQKLYLFHSRAKQVCLTTGFSLTYIPKMSIRSHLLTSQLCKPFFRSC